MNLTLLVAVVMLALWIVLGFVAPIPGGWVHLLYAGAVMSLTRRVLVGAPRFLS
ncbi:MAG: hypothetical protein HYS40_09490 [Gemmatimonadetes bacterium]|nr:hypothetical protein [Gemmatimonadota bacterium]